LNLIGTIPLSFTTERLLIRRYRQSDEGFLYDAARTSITEVFKFLPWCHPDYARDDARQWLESVESNWRDASAYSFAIFSLDGTEFHGGCGITSIDEHPIGNLGYWIKTNSTGKGIATEATRGLANFGIDEIRLQRIEIIMATHNEASKKVAEGAGASFEGTLRNRLLLHGKRHDAHVYSITPGD
jgi:ribosomal-protein-serine acetyltransferase